MENGFGSEKTRGVGTNEVARDDAVVGVWSRRDGLDKHI